MTNVMKITSMPLLQYQEHRLEHNKRLLSLLENEKQELRQKIQILNQKQ